MERQQIQITIDIGEDSKGISMLLTEELKKDRKALDLISNLVFAPLITNFDKLNKGLKKCIKQK